MFRFLPLALAAAGVVSLATPAHAITDPAGDFLPTYTGARGGDLDVLSADVEYDPALQTFSFRTTLADAVGSTPGALYVWGLDRGRGTQRLTTGTPSVGAGIPFDIVLLLRPDGTGLVNDFVNAKQTTLPAGTVKIAGSTLEADGLALSLFPSTGFAPEAYTWNLWPRLGTGSNTQISDFAPDASNAVLLITAVPEPQTWALMAVGLAAAGAVARSRRR